MSLRTRGATVGLAVLGVIATACAIPVASGPSLPAVSIRNADTSRVTVRWTGPGVRDDAVIEACDSLALELQPGQYTFDVRTRVDQVSLPVVVDPADPVGRVIGVTPDGDIGFGAPPENPSCANI